MTAPAPAPQRYVPPPLPTKAPADLEAALDAFVATLPALPGGDDRYSPRALTQSFLRRQKSHHTRRAYARMVGRWLGFCDWYRIDPATARLADIDEWKAEWDTEQGRTINAWLAAVSSWYKYLIANRVYEVNPAALAEREDVDRATSTTKALTPTEVGALANYAAAEATRLGSEAALRRAAIIELMIVTGVRTGAVINAQAGSGGDLFHTQGHRVLQYVNKGGKTKLAVIPPRPGRALDAYLAARAAREGVPVEQLTGWLFVTTNGVPLTSRDVRNLIQDYARAAGIAEWQRVVPHSLRHTSALMLDTEKRTVIEIMDFLGHEDPRTTLVYLATRNKLDNNPAYTLAGAITEASEQAARTPITTGPEHDAGTQARTAAPSAEGGVVIEFRPRHTGT